MLPTFLFWVAFRKANIPDHARLIRRATKKAFSSTDPKRELNNIFRGLRARKDNPLKKFSKWLDRARVRERANAFEQQWALRQWKRGIGRILSGMPAFKAFDFEKRLPPFTLAELAAIHVIVSLKHANLTNDPRSKKKVTGAALAGYDEKAEEIWQIEQENAFNRREQRRARRVLDGALQVSENQVSEQHSVGHHMCPETHADATTPARRRKC
jgi:hypothetical protein